MKKIVLLATLFLAILLGYNTSNGCTNVLVSSGASSDGSVMITYHADAGGFMEPLRFHTHMDYGPGTMLDIYEWDSGKLLGSIPQVAHTYSVIGNMNEHQVSVGETTFTGLEFLRDSTGLIDYGSMMYLALLRAKTAREGIDVMVDLVTKYGYYSTGESISIADKKEAWIFEIIGKGPGNKGAIWVARRVPEGYICVHANQARIREVPLNDPENCLYAPDIISFAKEKGIYKERNGKFSFADTYCPLDPGSLLYCEGRVWTVFKKAAPSQNFSDDYWRAVEGAEPYPLFIKPDKKLSVADVMSIIRDHFDGTPYDMTKGLAAEPYGNPCRWKPLEWQIDGDTVNSYGWERPISTQQTAFSFVSQMRKNMPDEIGGVFWYAVDDNFSSVYIPLYCCMTRPPESYIGHSIADFSLESAFWVFNLVANLAYTKYSFAIKDIQIVQSEFENKFHSLQPAVEKTATELMKTNRELAVEYLTDYSCSQAELVMTRWKSLWRYMVMKYNDGFINDVNVEHGRHPKSSYYSQEFYKRVLQERPGYYDVKWKKKNSTP